MVVVAIKQVKLKKIHKNLCSGCDAVIFDAIKKKWHNIETKFVHFLLLLTLAY